MILNKLNTPAAKVVRHELRPEMRAAHTDSMPRMRLRDPTSLELTSRLRHHHRVAIRRASRGQISRLTVFGSQYRERLPVLWNRVGHVHGVIEAMDKLARCRAGRAIGSGPRIPCSPRAGGMPAAAVAKHGPRRHLGQTVNLARRRGAPLVPPIHPFSGHLRARPRLRACTCFPDDASRGHHNES